jgi:hypothetical protein
MQKLVKATCVKHTVAFLLPNEPKHVILCLPAKQKSGAVVEGETMNLDLLSMLVGAATAIVGGIIGGWVQGRVWYHYELKRAAAEGKKRWERMACEWRDKGGNDSLRRADLSGAYLPYVNLSYSDLMGANLQGANLKGASLQVARLQDANLQDANLQDADLIAADMKGANLQGANLKEASYNEDTIWPQGFTPPPEAKKVKVRGTILNRY